MTDSQRDYADLLTTKEAADILGVTRQCLDLWRKKDPQPIPVILLGGRPYYHVSDVEEFKRTRKPVRVEPEPEPEPPAPRPRIQAALTPQGAVRVNPTPGVPIAFCKTVEQALNLLLAGKLEPLAEELVAIAVKIDLLERQARGAV